MEECPEEIALRKISWGRALFVFPLVILPLLGLQALAYAGRAVLRRTSPVGRSQRRSRAAPQPLGAAGLLLSWMLVPPVLAIWFAASGVAERVEAAGLLLIALATVCATPNLLPLDVLARLDRWWLGSDLPSYQLAFGHHARRSVAFLLRGTLSLLGATFIVGGIYAGTLNRVPRALSLVIVILLTAAVLALFLRVLVGPPTAYPQAVQVVLAAEGLQDPARQRTLLRVAAVLFALGTALSFVAVVFLHR
jgi:hypothetical protein